MSDNPVTPTTENPYRQFALADPDDGDYPAQVQAWDEGFAAGQSQAWDSAQAEIDAVRAAGRAAATPDPPKAEAIDALREGLTVLDRGQTVLAADMIRHAIYRLEDAPAATPDPPDGFRVTVYSGQSATDERPAGVSTRYAGATDLHDVLRRIGLEWKQADYMGQRQVVVTVDPVAHAASPDERLREALREIAESDAVDNALDPHRNVRIAQAALAAADREKPDADTQAAIDRADEELRAELDAPSVSDDPVPDPETGT